MLVWMWSPNTKFTHTQKIFGIKALWDIKVLLLHIHVCQEVFPILSEKKSQNVSLVMLQRKQFSYFLLLLYSLYQKLKMKHNFVTHNRVVLNKRKPGSIDIYSTSRLYRQVLQHSTLSDHSSIPYMMMLWCALQGGRERVRNPVKKNYWPLPASKGSVILSQRVEWVAMVNGSSIICTSLSHCTSR
jgi:uncharacterized protein with PQ loop repeat